MLIMKPPPATGGCLANATHCACTAAPRVRDGCLVPIGEAPTDAAAAPDCDATAGGTAAVGALVACVRARCGPRYWCSCGGAALCARRTVRAVLVAVAAADAGGGEGGGGVCTRVRLPGGGRPELTWVGRLREGGRGGTEAEDIG